MRSCMHPDPEPATPGVEQGIRKKIRVDSCLVALCVGLLLGSGCASSVPQYAVEINALASPSMQAMTEIAGTQYLLLPANPDLDPRNLEYQEFERVLEVALAGRGLQRVDDIAYADITILMQYGIGERETRITSYSPPYHVIDDYPYYDYWDRGRRGRFGYRRYSPFSTLSRYSYAPEIRTETTVNRYLELEARTVEPGQDPRSGEPVWSTEVRSRGELDDLRRVFPVLAGVAAEHVASDTGQIIEATIAEDDDRVVLLRPGTPSPNEPTLELED